jgi:hypothetical protein
MNRVALSLGVLAAAAVVAVAPAQAAYASSTIATASTSGFALTAQADNSAVIATTLTTKRTTLSTGKATKSGKAGLCWPTPFNPGVDARGYCWNNATDDDGSTGWNPQGFSVPHDATGDGLWGGVRWEVVSWHNGDDSEDRLRFVNRSGSTPMYFDVALVVFSSSGAVTRRAGHADGVAWYGDKLYIANGRVLDIVDLGDLTAYDLGPYHYVLPVRYTYVTSSSPCVPATGSTPCLNGISFDRSRGALLTNEYYNADSSAGRLVSWPLNLSTGRPTGAAGAAWTTPVWKMQGVTYAGGDFFISGLCPSSYNNSYRQPACVHKGGVGQATSVLTEVPDMTENLDWDASTGRIRGVNEVAQSDRAVPQRVVFDFSPTARAITVGRFRNVNSNMCLLPYGASLNDGAYIVQAPCDGKSAQNWYWNGNEMRSFVSNSCITVQNSSDAVNAHIVQQACNGSSYQFWSRITGNSGSMLYSAGSRLCMVPYAGSKSAGADIMQGNCDANSLAYAWIGYTP